MNLGTIIFFQNNLKIVCLTCFFPPENGMGFYLNMLFSTLDNQNNKKNKEENKMKAEISDKENLSKWI